MNKVLPSSTASKIEIWSEFKRRKKRKKKNRNLYSLPNSNLLVKPWQSLTVTIQTTLQIRLREFSRRFKLLQMIYSRGCPSWNPNSALKIRQLKKPMLP